MDYPVIRESMNEVGGYIGSLMDNGWGNEALAIGPGEEEEGDPERCPFTSLGFPDLISHAPLEGADDLGPPSIRINAHFITIPNLVGSWLDGVKVVRYGSEFSKGLNYFLFCKCCRRSGGGGHVLQVFEDLTGLEKEFGAGSFCFDLDGRNEGTDR